MIAGTWRFYSIEPGGAGDTFRIRTLDLRPNGTCFVHYESDRPTGPVECRYEFRDGQLTLISTDPPDRDTADALILSGGRMLRLRYMAGGREVVVYLRRD